MAAAPTAISPIGEIYLIHKLPAQVTKLNQISENEKEGFARLVSRYPNGKEEKVEWEKVNLVCKKANSRDLTSIGHVDSRNGAYMKGRARVYADIYSASSQAHVICRFNGFRPKLEALRQWIYSIWTEKCDIHLCSKGFFVVKFHTLNDKEYALNEEPWFWGNAGLFMTSWFPGFDLNNMVVSKIHVWVKLYNLPLHFWHIKVLAGIGNALGKFLKVDSERFSKEMYTFSRICVEVDLSQGLPYHTLLLHNEKQWAQPLDYENTAFRCCICHQTGHLQSACPQKKKDRKRRQPPKQKGWQFSATWTDDIEHEKNTETTNIF
eukprot:PITA_06747